LCGRDPDGAPTRRGLLLSGGGVGFDACARGGQFKVRAVVEVLLMIRMGRVIRLMMGGRLIVKMQMLLALLLLWLRRKLSASMMRRQRQLLMLLLLFQARRTRQRTGRDRADIASRQCRQSVGWRFEGGCG
jgi:hypothetical protein